MQLWFIEAEAQAHRLREGGGEVVEGKQAGGRSHLGEGDGAGGVVQGDGQTVP